MHYVAEDRMYYVDFPNGTFVGWPTPQGVAYLAEGFRRGQKLDGAHGMARRLYDSEEAAAANRPCPVFPDPRDEAREWGIPAPY